MKSAHILLLCMVVFVSCAPQNDNPVSTQDSQNSGQLSFSMSLNELNAVTNIQVTSVKVKLTGPSNVDGLLTLASDSLSASGTFNSLVPGTYAIFIVALSNADTVATGTGSATVSPGRITNASIVLTIVPGGLAINVTWSFQTSQILFQRAPAGSGPASIYRMLPTGADTVLIKSNGGAARWSADKTKIVYVSNQSTTTKYEVFLMNADGTASVQITNEAPFYGNSSPAFKGSTKIWYANAQTTGNTEMVEINLDGSGRTVLTNFFSVGTQCDFPDFFSDGSKVLYYKQGSSNAYSGEIYLANIDFSGEVQLTNTSTRSGNGRLAPDNSKVYFIRESGSPGTHDIYVMDINGTNVVRLTTAPSSGRHSTNPIPSPDGTKIAYGYYDGSQYDIWLMNSDGSGKVQLTNTAAQDEYPTDWK